MEPFVSNVWALTFALQSVHFFGGRSTTGKGASVKGHCQGAHTHCSFFGVELKIKSAHAWMHAPARCKAARKRGADKDFRECCDLFCGALP